MGVLEGTGYNFLRGFIFFLGGGGRNFKTQDWQVM